MIKLYPWARPTKRGEDHDNATFYFNRRFIQALAEFTKEQDSQLEWSLSRGEVLQQTLLKKYPELRARYNQLKQEHTNAENTLDITDPISVHTDAAHK